MASVRAGTDAGGAATVGRVDDADAPIGPADQLGGVSRRRAAALLFAVLGGAATVWGAWGAFSGGFERPLVAAALGLALIGANLAPVVAVTGGRIDAFTPVGALLVPIGLLLPLPEAVLVYALGEGVGVLAAHRWDRHVGGPQDDAAPRTTFVIGKSIVGAVLGLVALQQIAGTESSVPAQVLAAFAGVSISTTFDHTVVAVVAAMVGHRSFGEEFARGLGQLSMVAGGEVVAGALIAVLAGRDPWSLVLGLAMLGLLLVAGSAYARAAADREDSRELLRLAEELQEAGTVEDVEEALLASVRRMLPTDVVEIRRDPPDEGLRVWSLGDDEGEARWLATPRIVDTRDYEQQPMAMVDAAVALAHVAFTRAAAQQVLADQDRLRSLILSTVAHDLRSPLAVASGGLELLTEGQGELDVEQRARLLSASARAVDRIQRLIDDLLGLERSRDRLDTGVVAEVDEVARALLEDLDVGDAELELDLRPATAAVDPVSLGRIVENLVLNACKYSPRDEVVSVSCGPAEGGVSVVVCDRGPGVAPEDRHTIFEPFRQVGGRGGVGLGLYVTRRFVEIHDGSIRVDEAPGGGAAFHVWLPAAPNA